MSSVNNTVLPEDTTRFANRLGTKVNWGWYGGVAFGLGTQLLFLYTVIYLFLFLRYGIDNPYRNWWIVDSFLAIGFALPHSLLLVPTIQKNIKKHLPPVLMGCVHCTTTCITLLLMFHFWGSSHYLLWKATGWTETTVLTFFYGSWIALFYSLYLTGLGYQTGLTPWWFWATQQKPPLRKFITHGAFRWMRHPVYMSFLGLIWFTPNMTLDHAILTAAWTVYIYLGSYFKDRRLIRYIGSDYVEYGRRVSGLPWIGFGSLNRFR